MNLFPTILLSCCLIWALSLITWVVVETFTHLTLLTGAVAAALATVVGILSVVVGQINRRTDDRARGS